MIEAGDALRRVLCLRCNSRVQALKIAFFSAFSERGRACVEATICMQPAPSGGLLAAVLAFILPSSRTDAPCPNR